MSFRDLVREPLEEAGTHPRQPILWRQFIQNYRGKDLQVFHPDPEGGWRASLVLSGGPEPTMVPPGEMVRLVGPAGGDSEYSRVSYQGKTYEVFTGHLIAYTDTPMRAAYSKLVSWEPEPEEPLEEGREDEYWTLCQRVIQSYLGKVVTLNRPLHQAWDGMKFHKIPEGTQVVFHWELGDDVHADVQLRVVTPTGGFAMGSYGVDIRFLVNSFDHPALQKVRTFRIQVDNEPEEPLESIQEDTWLSKVPQSADQQVRDWVQANRRRRVFQLLRPVRYYARGGDLDLPKGTEVEIEGWWDDVGPKSRAYQRYELVVHPEPEPESGGYDGEGEFVVNAFELLCALDTPLSDLAQTLRKLHRERKLRNLEFRTEPEEPLESIQEEDQWHTDSDRFLFRFFETYKGQWLTLNPDRYDQVLQGRYLHPGELLPKDSRVKMFSMGSSTVFGSPKRSVGGIHAHCKYENENGYPEVAEVYFPYFNALGLAMMAETPFWTRAKHFFLSWDEGDPLPNEPEEPMESIHEDRFMDLHRFAQRAAQALVGKRLRVLAPKEAGPHFTNDLSGIEGEVEVLGVFEEMGGSVWIRHLWMGKPKESHVSTWSLVRGTENPFRDKLVRMNLDYLFQGNEPEEPLGESQKDQDELHRFVRKAARSLVGKTLKVHPDAREEGFLFAAPGWVTVLKANRYGQALIQGKVDPDSQRWVNFAILLKATENPFRKKYLRWAGEQIARSGFSIDRDYYGLSNEPEEPLESIQEGDYPSLDLLCERFFETYKGVPLTLLDRLWVYGRSSNDVPVVLSAGDRVVLTRHIPSNQSQVPWAFIQILGDSRGLFSGENSAEVYLDKLGAVADTPVRKRFLALMGHRDPEPEEPLESIQEGTEAQLRAKRRQLVRLFVEKYDKKLMRVVRPHFSLNGRRPDLLVGNEVTFVASSDSGFAHVYWQDGVGNSESYLGKFLLWDLGESLESPLQPMFQRLNAQLDFSNELANEPEEPLESIRFRGLALETPDELGEGWKDDLHLAASGARSAMHATGSVTGGLLTFGSFFGHTLANRLRRQRDLQRLRRQRQGRRRNR